MYIIYDCLKNSPFSIATKEVLKTLDISFIETKQTFKYNGEYFGRVCNLENFLYANTYNIAIAMLENKILLAIEEDSYANLAFTISILKNNQALKNFINDELHSNNININIDELHNHVSYFPFILNNHIDKIKSNIKMSFRNSLNKEIIPSISPRNTMNTGFSTCVFYGGRHFDCNNNDEYSSLKNIFEILGLKYIEIQESKHSFTHLEYINMEQSYKKSGDILFAGIDLGVDFLCVFSNSTFNMFDKNQKLCIKYSDRDPINIPNLNMAQILLICFNKANKAGFELHNIKPNFIESDCVAS